MALIVEFAAAPPEADRTPREFSPEPAVELTAPLATCAPPLLALADESEERELPAAVLPKVLPSCCADTAPEDALPAWTPLPRLALADVLLDAEAPACVSCCGCDCATATPE
ncbi:MAG: hypothetical protein WCC21_09815 [Candidatus Acidiferrales bacterium]